MDRGEWKISSVTHVLQFYDKLVKLSDDDIDFICMTHPDLNKYNLIQIRDVIRNSNVSD